jgi:hypothetical protein
MSALNIDQELRILTTMAANLTPYLYEDEVYGNLGKNFPQLTVGAVLMRLYRLETITDDLSPSQQNDVHEVRQKLESARYEWQNHYKEKIKREIVARLNTTSWFLDDCADSPASCLSGWPSAAEKRTIVSHLADEAKQLDAYDLELRAQVSDVDKRLRAFYQKGPFIWDERLQQAYSNDEFWWLYSQSS